MERRRNHKNRENKISSLQNRKTRNKKIDLPEGEIEYHISLGSSNSKNKNRRKEFENDTKHKNSSNARKTEKKQFNNSKSNAGSR